VIIVGPPGWRDEMGKPKGREHHDRLARCAPHGEPPSDLGQMLRGAGDDEDAPGVEIGDTSQVNDNVAS